MNDTKLFVGRVTPPADMLKAARDSLAEFPNAFEDLMQQTGGRAPTPDELCKMADGCRAARAVASRLLNAQYVAAINATTQPVTAVMTGTVN
jgi:hypothetical protein